MVDRKPETAWISNTNIVSKENEALFEMSTNEYFRYIVIDQGKISEGASDCSTMSKNGVRYINVKINNELTKKFEVVEGVNTFNGISIIDLKDELGFTAKQLFNLVEEPQNVNKFWADLCKDEVLVKLCQKNIIKQESASVVKLLNGNTELRFTLENPSGWADIHDQMGNEEYQFFMLYDYNTMKKEKELWLNNEPIPSNLALKEFQFQAIQKDKEYTLTFSTKDLEDLKGKKLYLVYDPQSAKISPDYDSALKVRVDNNETLHVGHEETVQQVEETKRPVVIIRKKKSTAPKKNNQKNWFQ